MKRNVHAILLAVISATLPISRSEAAVPAPHEVRSIAEEGYIYGLPLVMSYVANYQFWLGKKSGQYKCAMNHLNHERRTFTDMDTAVIVPNSDTPYSFTCLDLRAEPFVITVPEVEKERYYSVQLCDWNTFNFGYIGSRATGGKTGDFLIVGPDWQGEKPAGIDQVFRSTSQFTLAIFRTQLFGPEDMSNVAKIQDGYQIKPLSAFLGGAAPPPAPAIDFPQANAELVKTKFFDYLDFVLRFAPAGPEEKEIRGKLASIGIGPDRRMFDFSELPAEQKAAAIQGIQQANGKIADKSANLGKRINGWNISSAFGDREFYQGDWLLRAAAANSGIFGNSADEAVYPMTTTLADGETLDTSKHRYTLTFPAGQLPPVNAFWSVTMYDGKTKLLVTNPINRFLINSPMLQQMAKNDDGSLTLYLQKDKPAQDKESNWLPAPDGPLYLVMRLYWPKTEPPSILPPGAGTWAPPSIQRSK